MTFDKFLEAIQAQKVFKFSDGTDSWLFKSSRERVDIENYSLIILAESNEDGSLLAIRADDPLTTAKVFMIDEGEAAYFALSLSEVYHRKAVLKVYHQLLKGKDKHYEESLELYKDCLGCLYWIASGSMTSEYDEKRYNKERNKQAAKTLKKVAALDDPRACKELANYHIWHEPNPEAVLKWKQKATLYGGDSEKKELADYIIDERPDKIDLAIDMLNQIRATNYKVAWANWKEANIYLRGNGKPLDREKGLKLMKLAAELEWPMAMADLSYFAYQGVGMPADKDMAITLLEKANSLSDNRYIDILNKIRNS